MEGLAVGVPSVCCPTFADQPTNAAKLERLGVGPMVDRPTTSGPAAVAGYRRAVAAAVRTVLHDASRAYASAARAAQEQVKAAGGEAEAEEIVRAAAASGRGGDLAARLRGLGI